MKGTFRWEEKKPKVETFGDVIGRFPHSVEFLPNSASSGQNWPCCAGLVSTGSMTGSVLTRIRFSFSSSLIIRFTVRFEAFVILMMS